MKRFALGLSIVAAFALSSVGCDDDDNKGGRADAGPDAAAGGQCMGTFSSLDRTKLGQVTKPSGKCSAPTDLDVICKNDVRKVAGECGTSCLAVPDIADCTTKCVTGRLDPDLSGDCSSCYTKVITCTVDKCKNQCAGAPASEACTSCQATFCLPEFFQCSGLPGGPSPSDAGVTDATAG